MSTQDLSSSDGRGKPPRGYNHIRSQSSDQVSPPSYELQRTGSLNSEHDFECLNAADGSLMHQEPFRDMTDEEFQHRLIVSDARSELVYDRPMQWSIPRKPIPRSVTYRVKEQEVVEPTRDNCVSRPCNNSIFSIWRFELVSCILCLSSLFAIVITVYLYDGQPLPDWPYGLGLGSLIAIYSILFRAAGGFVLSEGLGQLKWTLFNTPQPLHDLAVYDDSTRGPLGCIQLLASLRRRQFVARAGALATLALLIVDPFNQQILYFEYCSPVDPQRIASLPRTQVQYGHGLHYWAGVELVEISMQNAAQAAIFAPDAVQVTPVCPSGNCTWPLYHTVGYCHQCADVTSYVTVTKDENTTMVELPSDQGLIVVNSTVPYLMISRETNDFVYAAFDGINLTNINERKVRQAWPSFLIPGMDVDKGFKNSTETRAYKCKIEACVRTINTSVTHGKLEESTIATYIDWGEESSEWGNNTYSMVDLECLTVVQRQILSDVGYHVTSTDKFIGYNGSILSNGTARTSPDVPTDKDLDKKLATIPAKCIYSISKRYEEGLDRFIAELFRGVVVGIQYEEFDRNPGPKVLVNLYARGPTLDSFDEAMSQVATSMTNYLRESSIETLSEPVEGQVAMSTTCLHVRWWWVTFTVVIAAIIVLFFLSMVTETTVGQGKWRHDFKTSALALMCAGLDEETTRQLRTKLLSGKLDDLKAASKNVPIQFVQREGKFVQIHK